MTTPAKPTASSANTPPSSNPPPPPTKGPGVWMKGWIWMSTRIRNYYTGREAKKNATRATKMSKKTTTKSHKVSSSTPITSAVAPKRSLTLQVFNFFLIAAGVVIIILIAEKSTGRKFISQLWNSDNTVVDTSLSDSQQKYVDLVHQVDRLEMMIARSRKSDSETTTELDLHKKTVLELCGKIAVLENKLTSISLRQDDIDSGVENLIKEVKTELGTQSSSRKDLAEQIANLSQKLSEKKASVAIASTPTVSTPPTPVSGPKVAIVKVDSRGKWTGYQYAAGEVSMKYPIMDVLRNQVEWDEKPGVEIQLVDDNKIRIVDRPITRAHMRANTQVQFVSKFEPMVVSKLSPRYTLGSNL